MSAAIHTGYIGGLQQKLPSVMPFVSNKGIRTVTADAAYTVTTVDVATGMLQFTGLTAGRNLTMPTAADLNAAFPSVGIGSSLDLQVSVTTAFALTLVTNTGITLAGRATVPASTHQLLKFIKTGESAWTVNCF